MSYFATVPTQSGLNELPTNPCKLLDFHLLSLAAEQSHQGNSGEREVLAVILGGKGTFTVNGRSFPHIGARANVFSGKPHAVYIPCGADYTIVGARPFRSRFVQRPQ
jgi:5-deoxy-glucuronate isomerase